MQPFKKRKLAGPLALLTGAALLAGCGAGGTKDDATVTIGLVSAFSGSAAAYGPAERASLQAAIEHINSTDAVKIDGKKVTFKLKTYDSAYDPTKAVTVTRQALTQDKVRYLEVLGGGIVPAVQPIVNKENALIFATAAGDAFIGKDQPKTFHPYYDVPESLHAILTSYLEEGGAEGGSVVALYPDDDMGESVGPQAVKQAESLKFTARTELVSRDLTDFAPVLSKIVKDTDVIDFGPLPPSQQATAAKQARQLGYKGIFTFSDTLALDTLLESVNAKDLEGSLSAPALDFQVLMTEEGKSWAAFVKGKTGQVDGWTAVAYDNLMLVAAAMNEAQSTDPAKVSKALETVSVQGILGEVSYGGEERYGITRSMTLPYSVAIVRGGKSVPATATS